MMRILVVEDEARLARLISRVLREEGYAPETASDGRTGLARALAEEFDLLIVDWMLPDLDGVEVIKRLRAAEMNVPNGPRHRGTRAQRQRHRDRSDGKSVVVERPLPQRRSAENSGDRE